MLPDTSERVRINTNPIINEQINNRTQASIEFFRNNPDLIPRHIEQLDREWDVERVLETNAAALALTGTALGAFRDRRWLLMPAVVTTFLLQHAVQGWCHPLPLIRKLGVRTQGEIDEERRALLEIAEQMEEQKAAAYALQD